MFNTYPKMKPSGIDWIGNIPNEWKIEPLKFHAKINGKTLDEKTDPDLDISYIDIGSVHSNGKIDEPEQLIFEDAPSRARRIVHENDTIISTVRTYLKAISFIDKTKDQHICSTGFAVITPLDTFYPKFLYWLLSSIRYVETIVANSVGVTYPAINSSKLGRFPCILPSTIDEQKLISKFLDGEISKIDYDITNNKKLIELLKEKIKAVIHQAVTKGLNSTVLMEPSGIQWVGDIPKHWELNKCRFFLSLFGSSTIDDFEEDKNGVPYFKVNDLNYVSTKLFLSNVKTKIKQNNLKIIKKPVILIPKRGEAIHTNKVAISTENCLFDSNIMGLRVSKKFNIHYVAFSLLARTLSDVVDKTTIPQINNKHIKPLLFPFPPIKEQEAIGESIFNEINKIEDLLYLVSCQGSKLEQYRQSLILCAVTGQICVID